jgi:hypothetical protein
VSVTCCSNRVNRKEANRERIQTGNKVLGRIFGPKRDKVAGCWKQLHNEELHSLYSSPNTIKMSK